MSVAKLLSKSKIKISLDDINKLKKGVKNNFESINKVSCVLDKYKFLKSDINNRIDKGVLFQPGRIVETVIVQVISDFLDCSYVNDGIYENERYTIMQDGGSNKVDLTIVDKRIKKVYMFEIKEPVAYGKSCGFTYDENGKPNDFTSRDANFKEYAKSLFDGSLKDYNIFENNRHNKYYNITNIKSEYDYIISYDNKGNLTIMTNDEYTNMFDFKIEIRSCGRNTRKVFTTTNLNIENDLLYVNENDLYEITQRGGKNSSRYKYIINNTNYSFKKKDLIEIDGKLCINIKKVRQHVGELSIIHCMK